MPQAYTAPAAPARYEWVTLGPDAWALFLGQQQVGGYRDGVFWGLYRGTWYEAVTPAGVSLPARRVVSKTITFTWGL